MTDVQAAGLYVMIGGIFSTLGAVAIAKLNQIGKAVDGNLKEVTAKLATATGALLALTEKSSLAEGKLGKTKRKPSAAMGAQNHPPKARGRRSAKSAG
jgi:hypothetical protein